MRVLLAEDDAALGFVICRELKKGGLTLDWLRDGKQVLNALDQNAGYEVLVLDLGLPSLDGHQILRTLRANRSQLGVLVISGCDQVNSRIQTLALGADDYLIKPFDSRELLARILAVVRRNAGMLGPILSNGQVELDPATRKARNSEKYAQMSAREYDLLFALLLRPGTILSRAQLEERVYGWGQEVNSNAIEFLIHSVRKKLGASVIQNLRGIGWFVERGD